MRMITIQSHEDQSTLYEGPFNSAKEALEMATKNNIDLSNANLKHLNLSNANLDDAQLQGADFTGSNLTGVNLSEAQLTGAAFTNTALFNTCLAYSDIRRCRFDHAAFGGTDIHGSDISGCTFSWSSCSTVNFRSARAMNSCQFIDNNNVTQILSQPPIVISGATQEPIILTNNLVRIKDQSLKLSKRKLYDLISELIKDTSDAKLNLKNEQ